MFQICHAFTSRAKVSEIDRDHARGLVGHRITPGHFLDYQTAGMSRDRRSAARARRYGIGAEA